MIKRVVEIDSSAFLSLRRKQLVVKRDGEDDYLIPIEDLGVLVLSNPTISVTQAALAECWKGNVITILCDDRRLPGALVVPLEGNDLQPKALRFQVRAKPGTKKRLWKQIVEEKISNQADLLAELDLDSYPVRLLAKKVKYGDSTNVEAQAARLYWPTLFGKDFRRDIESPGINGLLNYGYAVLRSGVARGIVSAGLHPSVGIHHSNQYNHFSLVDDMMEPFRPMIDKKVYDLSIRYDDIAVSSHLKQEIISVLSSTCILGNRRLPILVAFQLMAANLREVFQGNATTLEIPRF